MRILFFSHYFPPDGGALASRTYAHCRRWVEAGHQVTVVASAPNYPRGVLYPGYRNRLRQVEDWEGVRVVRVVTFLAANAGIWRRTLSFVSYMLSALILSALERRPDVVVATSPQFFCGWAGVFAAKLRGRPLVLEIRDLWPESIAAVGAIQSRAVIAMLARLELAMYRSARQIVTVGEGYRQRLLERGADGARLAVVMNGVDGELFSPRDRDEHLAERVGITGRFVVAYCGVIGMAHGLEVVLRAASLLRDSPEGRRVAFLLVGDGACLDDLKAMAARDGLDNVVFTGNVARACVPGLISLSDVCLVHLRASDTFTTVMPSKIFEAAAMAKPVILGVRGFAAEFVGTAGCGLCIEPEDEYELVDAVLRLSADAPLREKLGRMGHEYVVRHFSRDVLAQDYLKLIHRTVVG